MAGAQQGSAVETQKQLMLEVLPYPVLLLVTLALYRMDVKKPLHSDVLNFKLFTHSPWG